MTLALIVLAIVCIFLMGTFVVIVKEMHKNDSDKTEKFLGTISYLTGAGTEPEDASEEIVSLDDVSTDELLKALDEEQNEND